MKETESELLELDFLSRLYSQNIQKGERVEADKIKDKYFDLLNVINERRLRKNP